MVKRLGLPAFLAVALLVLTGAGGGSYDGGTYASRGGGYLGGGASKVDTFKLKINSFANPQTNADAADSGDGWLLADGLYDVVRGASDGSWFRYGAVAASAPTAPYYNVNGILAGRQNEDDDATTPFSIAFVAFNCSDIPAGYRIEEASFFINPMRLSSTNLTTGYFSVRADTVLADYAMLDSDGSNVAPDNGQPTFPDTCLIDVSWNEVNVDASTAWTVAPGDRDDWHDWGPRCDAVFAPLADISYATKNDRAVKVNVTKALQQVLDRGGTDGWVIFVIHNVGTPTSTTNWAASQYSGKSVYGGPSLHVVATSRGDARPWGGTAPVSIVWDDNYNIDPFIYSIFDSVGYDFTTAAVRQYFGAPDDSLWTANSLDGFDLIVHSKTHTMFGGADGLSDSEEWYEVARDWIPTAITGYDPADTLGLRHFAWVGGSPTATLKRYDLHAIGVMIRNGYNTCRAVTYTETTPIGALSYPAWDQYVNLFAIQAQLTGTLFLGSTQAEFEDELLDYVDQVWTDHGRAALIFYGHGFSNGATYQKTRWFVEAMGKYDFITYRPYGWVADRLAARPRVDPGVITVANGATTIIETSAAKYDSVKTADFGGGAGWPDSVWVGPK